VRACVGLVGLTAVAAFATPAIAADHRDGDGVKADPAADINDVYAFMDSDDVVLAMTVSPFADVNTKFTDAVQYVFHVDRHPEFDPLGASAGSTNVICQFDASQKIECWIGTEDYVTGDASDPAGLASVNGKFTVFAGLRADPFFFYLTGFNAARAAVLAALPMNIPPSALNPNGCPIIPDSLAAAGRTALQAAMPSDNNFATANTLAIVIRADKSLFVDADNTFFSVYASTHAKP
jgi:hypothetical protein